MKTRRFIPLSKEISFVCRKSFGGVLLGVLLALLVGGLAGAAPMQQGVAPETPRVVAVVSSKGASLYDAPGGAVIDSLIVGARLDLQARTQDGKWVLGTTVDGLTGWVEAERLLVLGLRRLPVQKPTPVPRPSPTATPSPTTSAAPTTSTAAPTPTPFVPPEGPSALALVRMGGATLWNEAGAQVAELEPGAHLRAAYRTPDGGWFFVYDDAGVNGWAAAEELIVVGGADLPVREVSGRPGQPVTATVGDIGALLRVRTGPSTAFPILIKVRPGDEFTVLGRNRAGDWLNIRLTDAPAEAGWVAAAYVITSAPVESLPVVEE